MESKLDDDDDGICGGGIDVRIDDLFVFDDKELPPRSIDDGDGDNDDDEVVGAFDAKFANDCSIAKP